MRLLGLAIVMLLLPCCSGEEPEEAPPAAFITATTPSEGENSEEAPFTVVTEEATSTVVIDAAASSEIDLYPTRTQEKPERAKVGERNFDYTFKAQGKEFGAYLSRRYGANDVWLAYTTDGKNYKDVFTGCTLQKDAFFEDYTAAYMDGKIMISYPRVMHGGADSESVRLVATLAELERDSDSDGLTDLTEYRFWTDATKADTDGDGKKDGEDLNPLTSSKVKLTEEQQVWRAGFKQFRFDFKYIHEDKIVLAEFEKEWDFFELPGRNEHVLAITSDQVERFAEQFGYITPRLIFIDVTFSSTEEGKRTATFDIDELSGPLQGLRHRLTFEQRRGGWKLTGSTIERIY